MIFSKNNLNSNLFLIFFRAILIQNLIRFDERDIYINPNFKTELIERTNGSFEVPVLFVNGKTIGVCNGKQGFSLLLISFKNKFNNWVKVMPKIRKNFAKVYLILTNTGTDME